MRALDFTTVTAKRSELVEAIENPPELWNRYGCRLPAETRTVRELIECAADHYAACEYWDAHPELAREGFHYGAAHAAAFEELATMSRFRCCHVAKDGCSRPAGRGGYAIDAPSLEPLYRCRLCGRDVCEPCSVPREYQRNNGPRIERICMTCIEQEQKEAKRLRKG